MARAGRANAKEKQTKMEKIQPRPSKRAPICNNTTQAVEHRPVQQTRASFDTRALYCPVCEGAVTSAVRTGRVWHRPCGRFRVKDGRVADRRFLLRGQCGKYCADRASEPPRNMRQPILCPGRTCERGDAAAPPQVSSVRYSSVVRAFVGTNSRNACDAVGETLLDDTLAGRETSVASMTKKATPTKQLPQHGKSQLQRQFGPGEAFGVGTGGHPSVLKPDKTSQGASRSMAKASSNYILGVGRPLGSGPGAIRQF